MKTDEEIIAEITGALGFRQKKQPRRMPRCLGCGKVSKHIFCATCRPPKEVK